MLLGSILCFGTVYSQQSFPDDTSGNAYTEALSKSYPVMNELFLADLKAKTTDKKLLKHYQASYKEIFKGMNEVIKEGQMIYSPGLSVLLEELLLEIKAKNPSIPQDIQVFLLREDLPNAVTMGDNNIFVNMGLFYYMDNEDQVAGVLSHEVAHLILSHALKGIRYNYEQDKESATKVKALQGVEARKTERAFDLLRSSIYKEGRMRRDFELQADSMGYALFKNTGYNHIAFVEALENIQHYDTVFPGNLAVESYRKFFDLPTQKYNDKWLVAEDFSSYNYESFTKKLDKDSVSSHPEITERIQHLKASFPELSLQEKGSRSGIGTFSKIRSAADSMRVPNYFFNERYGEVIYASLISLQKNPGDQYYRLWLAKGLQKIYEARRDYKLNKYLDRVSPKNQPESYIRFLNFMWNLSLDELKNIADFYNTEK